MKASKALARVGAHGLPGANSDPVRVDRFSGLLDLAAAQRMLPWLTAAVDAGVVEAVTDDDRKHLRQRSLHSMQSTLAAQAAAGSVVTWLSEIGIADVRVLKGCATAHLDYADPGQRFSSDVDVLVRSGDFEAALTTLSAGEIPVPRSRTFRRRYGKATAVTNGNGVEIDIHVMLTHGYFGLALPLRELFKDPEPFKVGGSQMFALDRPNRLLHAANHVGASEHIALHSARDVPQLALTTDVEWRETVERATRWNVDGLFARGVLMAWRMFDLEPHPLTEWAENHRPTRCQRLALRTAGDRIHGPQMTGPLALPLYRWPGYILPFLWPSGEFLASRGENRPEFLRRLGREVWSGNFR